MLYKTHIAGGIIAGLLVGFNPVGIIISGASSLLPDIDSPHSFAGRRIWPISALIQHTAGHRGCFHSLLAAVIIYFFSIILIPKYALYIFVGYLSHLFLDALNPEGVPLLWPLDYRLRIPVVRTGSVIEKLLMAPLFLVVIFLTYKGVVL
jgi:inner membrane protein